jgi:hypothetical protein
VPMLLAAWTRTMEECAALARCLGETTIRRARKTRK